MLWGSFSSKGLGGLIHVHQGSDERANFFWMDSDVYRIFKQTEGNLCESTIEWYCVSERSIIAPLLKKNNHLHSEPWLWLHIAVGDAFLSMGQ